MCWRRTPRSCASSGAAALSDAGRGPGPGIDADSFREALARWASGVAVVALREEGRVLATTVSALMSVSVKPPLIVLALGPGAQVLPYLTEGRRFGVSLLGEEQSRLARVFSDPYPVGPSPFHGDGPVVAGAIVRLGCVVHRVDAGGDHRLVLACVESTAHAPGEPLLRWERAYRRLAPA